MRVLKIAAVLVPLFIASGLNANGQCKAFAKRTCLPELGAYTHDGNYHATVLAEGEEAELYKTFYSDMEYRLSICGDEDLPPVEFVVLDVNKNILYSNKEAGGANTWICAEDAARKHTTIMATCWRRTLPAFWSRRALR